MRDFQKRDYKIKNKIKLIDILGLIGVIILSSYVGYAVGVWSVLG